MKAIEFKSREELINALYKIGTLNMSGFLTDINHDADEIRNYPSKDLKNFKFHWVARTNGTKFCRYIDDAQQYARDWSNEYLFTVYIMYYNKKYVMEFVHNMPRLS